VFRNQTAHEPRITKTYIERDALDLLTLGSSAQRRIDVTALVLPSPVGEEPGHTFLVAPPALFGLERFSLDWLIVGPSEVACLVPNIGPYNSVRNSSENRSNPARARGQTMPVAIPPPRLLNSLQIHRRVPGLDTFQVGQRAAIRRQLGLFDQHVRDVIVDREARPAPGADETIPVARQGSLAHWTDQ
jgi:hypothetical protein